MVETKTMLSGVHVIGEEIRRGKAIIESLGLDLTVKVESKDLVTVTGTSEEIGRLFAAARRV